jgi:AbrB family looped-hinge helix DNA binding protein
MNRPKGKYAWTVKVGEKGQFVIPKEARDMFDIKPGDTLILLGDEKRGIAIPPKSEFLKYAAKIFDDMSSAKEKSE